MRGYIFPQVINDQRELLPHIEKITQNNDECFEWNFVAGSDSASVMLDLKKKVVGYLFMQFGQCGRGKIRVEYGPFLHAMFYSKTFDVCSNRLIFDEEITALRYIRLIFEDCEGLIQLQKFGIRSSSYDYREGGVFKSDNILLNKIWSTGAYTLQLCTQKETESISLERRATFPQEFLDAIKNWKCIDSEYVIFDGPRRDREAWIGDIRTEALIAYAAFSDYAPVRASLQLFADLQDKAGLIPGSAASRQNFIEYNLWWVITIYEYYEHTADMAFLDRMYPYISKLYDYLQFSMDENYFIENDSSWLWTFIRSGKTASAQCVLYYALICIKKILLIFNQEIEANRLSCRYSKKNSRSG